MLTILSPLSEFFFVFYSVGFSYASGYEWCVEAIKQSVHASLATELEMTKAGDLLRSGDIEGAVEVLKVFRQQDTKIASAAANNLSMIALLVIVIFSLTSLFLARRRRLGRCRELC